MSSTNVSTPDELADRVLALGRGATLLDLGSGASSVSRSLRRKGAVAVEPGASEPPAGPGEHLAVLPDGLDTLEPGLLDQATSLADRVLVLLPQPAEPAALAELATHLADRSFHRQPDADVVRISPAAMLFAREEQPPADLVQRYERLVAEVVRAGEVERQAMQDEVVAARHSLLVNRDHVVGTEAEIGRINRDVLRLTHELAQAKKRVAGLTQRRDGLKERVETLRRKLATAQRRNARLAARVEELERRDAGRPSLSGRIYRRLPGRRG